MLVKHPLTEWVNLTKGYGLKPASSFQADREATYPAEQI